jgi:DNA invertase Pin-like site-specific DNA recombinase
MAGNGKKVEAVAYIRTSSAANVGADKDSDKRQRTAIEGFSKRAGFALVDEFTDAAVSGADPIETRPGFSACSIASRPTAFVPSSSRTHRGSPASS